MSRRAPVSRERLESQFRTLVAVMIAAARRLAGIPGRRRGDDGTAGAPVPVPSSPPPGLSERGPRRRGPRAEATAYATPEGGSDAV